MYMRRNFPLDVSLFFLTSLFFGETSRAFSRFPKGKVPPPSGERELCVLVSVQILCYFRLKWFLIVIQTNNFPILILIVVNVLVVVVLVLVNVYGPTSKYRFMS